MRTPPRKQSGVKTGRRRVAGAVLDVAGAAEFLGVTEKVIRARAARMLLPHHRLGGRLVFVRRELEEFFAALPGCSIENAIENISARHDLTVHIVFDSAKKQNELIQAAERQLARELKGRGAVVRIVDLPDLPGLEKTGADDFLVHPDGGPDVMLALIGNGEEFEPGGIILDPADPMPSAMIRDKTYPTRMCAKRNSTYSEENNWKHRVTSRSPLILLDLIASQGFGSSRLTAFQKWRL